MVLFNRRPIIGNHHDTTADQLLLSDAAEHVSAFLESHRVWAYRLARMIVVSPELAEDVSQEALIRAHRGRGKLAAADDPVAWLRKVVVRCAISAITNVRPEEELTEFPAKDIALEDRLAVEATLAKLPPHHRVILALALGEQLSYEEIGDALQLPSGTVGSRLFAAKKAFRKAWEDAP